MMDNRVFERSAVRFPVKFDAPKEDFATNLFLRDISAQGLKLLSYQPIQLHEDVSILVKLPDQHQPMSLTGTAVWVKNKNPGVWEMGLKFPHIKLMTLQRLFRFCS